MIMYKRKEDVEAEHLDWEDHSHDKIQEKNLKVTLPFNKKQKRVLFDNDKNEPNLHNIKTYLNGNEYVLLGLSILIVPYLVGLLFNLVLYYIYSGISLGKVFNIEKQYKIWELWTIGAYTFVTIWIIYILLKTFTNKS